MFETRLEELNLAEAAQLAGMDPFSVRDRLLIRALKGRCCFDVGLAMKCFEGTVEIKEGRRGGLELSAGSQLLGIKLTTAYDFERTIEYSCGRCDSVAPMLVFDDAYIHVWEVRVGLSAGLWKRNETLFIPTKRPYLASNKVLDDPECGCASASPPSAGPEDHISLAVEEMVTRLVSSLSLTPPPGEEELPDPSRVVNEALLAVEEVVKPLQTQRPERVGFADMHGNATWFTDRSTAGTLPRATLIGTDCNAGLRRRLAVGAEDDRFPMLAVAPATRAVWGRLSLALDTPDRGLVPYENWDVTVASDQATAAWATIDFSAFGAGNAGEIKLELFDSDDNLAAEPLVEEFVVVLEPALSAYLAPEPEHA